MSALNPDTDKDAFVDGYEVEQGSDPLDFVDTPGFAMEINGNAFYTRTTNLLVRFPGLRAHALDVGEDIEPTTAVSRTFSDSIDYGLRSASNGARTLYARLYWSTNQSPVISGHITYDDTPPTLGNLSPTNEQRMSRRWIKLTGTAVDETSPVRVFVNDEWAHGYQKTNFWHDRIPLEAGTNALTVVAADMAGNRTTQSLEIVQDTTGDLTPPALTITLPGLNPATNGAIVTYGADDTLYFSGSTDDETAQVLVDNMEHGIAEAVVSGTQIWGQVHLRPGSNHLWITARDAAWNSNVFLCTVIRDTGFVFRITNPAPYQVVNAASALVSGIASPSFLNATITVNGVATTIEDRGDHVAFTTVAPVPLGVGMTILGAEAYLGELLHGTERPVLATELMSLLSTTIDIYRHGFMQPCSPPYLSFTHITNQSAVEWSYTDRVERILIQNASCSYGNDWCIPPVFACDEITDQRVEQADLPTTKMVLGVRDYEYLSPLVTFPEYSGSTIVHGGSSMTIRSVLPATDAQMMIFQFEGMSIASSADQYIRDPREVSTAVVFRGHSGFVLNSNVAFLVKSEPSTDVIIREEDFEWPVFTSVRKGHYGWSFKETIHQLEFLPLLKASVLMVDFDKDPVKAGICLDGQSHDVRGTVTATITPKEVADQVSFDSSNHNRATVAEVDRVDQGNSKVVTLKVTGVSATPDTEPNGDTDLRALVGGQVCGSTKILVLVPKTSAHSVSSSECHNYALLHSSGDYTPRTFASSIVTITIYDQFGNVLDSLYNGNGVVTEEFVNQNPPGYFAQGEIPITVPDNSFENGIKLDESADSIWLTSILIPPDLKDEWESFQLDIGGGNNNTFAYSLNGDETGTGTQIIRVHGHRVTPDYTRVKTIRDGNIPPCVLTVTDSP